MKRQFISVVVLLLAISVGASAQKRAFTIEDVYRVKGVSDVRVSPDAKSVAYVLTESDLGRSSRIGHIWMMDIDGQHPRQLTFGAKGESSPRFSPDGKFLLMISSRDGAASLYLLPVAGGEAKRLTNISTGISDPLWSPDSKWIAFSTDVYPACGDDDACNQKTRDARSNGQVKGHIADSLLYRHWTDWKDGTRTHIFLAEAETGTMRDLTPGDFDSPTFQLGGPLQYDFSPDGSEIAFVSNHDKTPASSTNNDLWTLSLANRAVRPVNITASNPSYDGSPKYSPDGKYIAYRMQKLPGYESDLFRLAIYERRTGASTVLTESSFNNWVDAFEWAPDSRSIFFTGPVEGQTPIYRLDLESKRVTEVLADKTIDEFEFTRDFKRMLYVRRSTGDPVEIYSIEISNGSASTARRLTNVNAALAAEVDIRPAETMWVEGSGGSRIQVFIVKPHGFDPARKYPLILNVHGGPQQQWTDGFRGDWQVYPGAGYVVAFANPRGSTGYGQQFTAQISGDYGGAVFEDLMKVSDALEKLPYVDRNRMGAMGWSFGGYMMNWFEGHTDRFKAIASMMGLFDLRSFYGATEELWFPEWDLKGQPWNSDLYEKWSPSNYVKNFKMPALVISGERDYRVPYTQSLQFFTALQKMNVPSKLIIYSNAGHWPSWYEMALYYTAHLEWFSKYLGGEAPPWTSEEFLNNAVFDSKTGNRVVPKK
ncbi:MAG TPA: S9 family peptidase [Terriglobia bacterium]|nr:S9 family peptidase [Terriglobia bacterium]